MLVMVIRNFVGVGGIVVVSVGNCGNNAFCLLLFSGVFEVISVAVTYVPGELGSWFQVKSLVALLGNYGFRSVVGKWVK